MVLKTQSNSPFPVPCSWEMSEWVSLKVPVNIPAQRTASPEHPKAESGPRSPCNSSSLMLGAFAHVPALDPAGCSHCAVPSTSQPMRVGNPPQGEGTPGHADEKNISKTHQWLPELQLG